MTLLLIFLFVGVWLYCFWALLQILMSWKARRDYHKALHPKKRWHWPFKARSRAEEPKRRILYRPPNKDA